MGTLPQPVIYKYADASGEPLLCHSSPDTTKSTLNGQAIAQGEQFAVSAVQDFNGHSMAQTPKGWASMGTPAGYWATAVCDTQALEDQIISLEHALGTTQAEADRLGGIIDRGAAELAKK